MKSYNFQKNKQAFGQSKKYSSPWDQKQEHSARAERRRQARGQKVSKQSKEQLYRSSYESMLELAYKEQQHIEELKFVRLIPELDRYVDVPSFTNHKQYIGIEVEFRGFVKTDEKEDMYSYSSYYSYKKIIVKAPNLPAAEVPMNFFEPVILKEDIALYIMKKEIGL